jgi:hypothetical protein
VQEWLRRAVPASTCIFTEGGEGVLIVGRAPLAIRDDVLLVRYDQVADLAGAFLLNVVSPGIAQAMQLDMQIARREAPGRPNGPQTG